MKLLEKLPPHSAAWIVVPVDLGPHGALSVDAFLCRGSAVKPLVLVVAGVHGDEYEGPAAIARLSKNLHSDAMRGSVIAIPSANAMAFVAAQRNTPSDGLNLARTFPGNPGGSATERLAAWLFENLVRQADYLIDLHSGGIEYRFVPLAGFYGAPAHSSQSFDAARHFGLRHLWQLPETSGVLSCEAWKANVVSIGTEYHGAGQLCNDGVVSYVAGVLSCLAGWGVCPDEHVLPASSEVITGDWQLASTTGLFCSQCTLAQEVVDGEPLAEILNIRGEVIQRFVASKRGIVMGLRSKAHIRAGDWGVLVGAPMPEEAKYDV